MKHLIPLGVLAFGIYQFVTNWNTGMDATFLAKNGAAVLAGAGFELYNFKDYFTGLIGKLKNGASSKVVEDKIYVPSTVEEKDFACLVHLKNRVHAAGSKEGIETVEKLNQIIFSLSDKTDNEKA